MKEYCFGIGCFNHIYHRLKTKGFMKKFSLGGRQFKNQLMKVYKTELRGVHVTWEVGKMSPERSVRHKPHKTGSPNVTFWRWLEPCKFVGISKYGIGASRCGGWGSNFGGLRFRG